MNSNGAAAPLVSDDCSIDVDHDLFPARHTRGCYIGKQRYILPDARCARVIGETAEVAVENVSLFFSGASGER